MSDHKPILERSSVEDVVGSENMTHWDAAKNGEITVQEMIGEMSKGKLGQIIIKNYDVSDEDIAKWESGEFTCDDLCGRYIFPEECREEHARLTSDLKAGKLSRDDYDEAVTGLLNQN